jgi:hypothetical protein
VRMGRLETSSGRPRAMPERLGSRVGSNPRGIIEGWWGGSGRRTGHRAATQERGDGGSGIGIGIWRRVLGAGWGICVRV